MWGEIFTEEEEVIRRIKPYIITFMEHFQCNLAAYYGLRVHISFWKCFINCTNILYTQNFLVEQGIHVPDERLNHNPPATSPPHKEEPTVQHDKSDRKTVSTDANMEIDRYCCLFIVNLYDPVLIVILCCSC